jgi:glyoxylase-like metal-dependent hydrolase (beta-lactamase superfamily II)
MTLEYHVLDTGYCLAHESMMMQGGRRTTVACHSLVGLLRHPTEGWTLWDTGYAPWMLRATRRLPYRLYRLVTPLRIAPGGAVAAQLPRFGLTPADIKRVIISHFHADHIAGLRDFPQAEFWATAAAWADAAPRRGVNALRRAFIPSLLPPDFRQRLHLLPTFSAPPLPGLGPTADFFGDMSLQLVALPGHARGQIGALAQTTRGPVLFAADGCWLTRAARERRPPHPITRLFTDDTQAVRTTLDGLHTFMAARPDVAIIPTHCPEAYRREVREVCEVSG